MSGANTGNNVGVYGTKGIAAAANMPPSRFGQNVTVDPSGNFWVFGGATAATLGTTTFLNDLRKYNPTTNQWTWISDDNIPPVPLSTQGAKLIYTGPFRAVVAPFCIDIVIPSYLSI